MKLHNEAAPIALSQLLRIDVTAEQRKLGRYTLQGPWQLPSELVRMRFARGVREISLSFKRRAFELHDDGPPIDPATMDALTVLSDPEANDERRHLALVELEQSVHRALISLATLNDVRFEIPPGDGFTLRVMSPELDDRAQRFARYALRFAALTGRKITISGKTHADELGHLLASRRLQTPLVGAMGMPTVGRDGQLWLLQHGVLSTHQSFSTTPAFHCVLELPGHDSAATIRQSAERMLPQLAKRYQELLLSLAERDELPEPVRQAVATALLECARTVPTFRNEMGTRPLFRRVFVEGRVIHRLPVSLDGLIAAATRDGGTLCAIDADSTPPRALDEAVFVLSLGRAERALLVESFGLQFVPPITPQKERAFPLRWRNGLARVTGWLSARLSRGTSVDPDTLAQNEIRFLEGLSRILGTAAADLSLHEGSGPVRLSADQSRPQLVESARLPRDNPLLSASIERLGNDGDHWRYPVALALAHGKLRRGGRTTRARADWHRSKGTSLETTDAE